MPSFDIDKICRTCLALNGPLLSIYEGSSGGGGTGCIGDMLQDFTNAKLLRSEYLPEKVCLACISEINRCYSFKIKCENSIRTLCQLIPEAELVLDDDNEFIRENNNASAETLKKSTFVQTQKRPYKHQQVQTESEQRTASASHVSKDEKDIMHVLKEEQQIDVMDNLKRPLKIIKLETPAKRKCIKVIEEHNNKVITRKESEDKQARSTDNSEAIATKLAENNEIDAIYEISEEEFEYNTETVENDAEQRESAVDTGIQNFEQLAEGEEEDYEQLVLTAEMSEANAEQSNFNFTIYNNEDGETEFIAKRSKCPPTDKSVQQKAELKCSDCIMTFISQNALRRHVMRRHAFTNTKQTAEDEEAETTEEPQNEISETLPPVLQAALLQETQDVTPIRKRDTFVTNSSNTTATETLKAKLKYFCEQCNAGFAVRKSLNYHCKQSACTAINYKCDECDRVFISEEGLLEHKEMHGRGHICSECNKELKSKELLSQHLIEEHNRSIRNQCTVCKKVFTMLSALKDHMRIHSGEKPFLCPFCGKAFSQNANLKQHVMRHSRLKSFHCDECDNSYVTKAELFSHKRTHTGDQPFKCEFCDAHFTTSSSLVKHKRKHTGERPYACDICPMRFAALNVLKNHRRTHTGEKPFKCPYCNKGFTQKGDCQIHQRTHTGERKYVCACGEKFTHLGTLRTHVKTHDKRINQALTRSKKMLENHEAVLHYNLLDEEVEQINNSDSVDVSKEVIDTQDLTADEELMHISIETAE